MKPPRLVRSISMIAMTALLLMKATSAADIHVTISSGFHGAYSELGPAFERATGNHLITTRGPSMGDSPEAIPTRLSRAKGPWPAARRAISRRTPSNEADPND